MKNTVTLPRGMNYIGFVITGWGEKRFSPTPCDYLLSLLYVRVRVQNHHIGYWKGDKIQKRVLKGEI